MSETSFVPPRCPNRCCPEHLHPHPGFFLRSGSYSARCRPEPVPRFRCRTCHRSFSRQTFRIDYRDRRPETNAPLVQMLVSGVGLRQAARNLGLGVHAVQKKFCKLARHVNLLNRNLECGLPAGRTLLLDELESYEHRRITPVTMPVLIDGRSKFVVAVDVAPIRRVAQKGSPRRRRLERFEALHGKRKDRGHAALRRIFGRLQRLLAGKCANLVTDLKPAYARMCKARFGEQVEHTRVSSKLPRTVKNPLFAINLTDAMMRDNNGRLRRRSWLVSKLGKRLRLQAGLFVAYRNLVRPRHNDDEPGLTPGVALGLIDRRLAIEDLVAWRQDWRKRSIFPASIDGRRTVLEKAS